MSDMPTAFETYPLDFSRPELKEIQDLLAATIFIESEIITAVQEAGLSPGNISWQGAARLQWRAALVEASHNDLIPKLLDVVGTRMPVLGQRIKELTAPTPIVHPSKGKNDDLSSSEAAGWKGFSGKERIIVEGKDSLLGIEFLSKGIERAKSVCRLTVRSEQGASHGTGFAIGSNLVLTNHHVLFDWDNNEAAPELVYAWFDYQMDQQDMPVSPIKIECVPNSIVGDRTSDWAVVKTASPLPNKYPPIDLHQRRNVTKNDRVYIIQHPEGGPKMIGMHHNLVRHADDKVVQYWTDTKAGSSGAPVFNDNWEIIAIHHRWVESPGDELAFRNQGIRIGRVVAGLNSAGILST